MLGRQRESIKKMVLAFVMTLMIMITGVGVVPVNVDAASEKVVKKLSVSKKYLSLEEGESDTVKYKVTASSGTSKKILLKVADKEIVSAKVQKGKIKVSAKSEGTTTITVATKEKNKNGKRIAKKIQVEVKNEDAELDYDFEDDDITEEDVSQKDNKINEENNITTEASNVQISKEDVRENEMTDNMVTEERAEKTTEKEQTSVEQEEETIPSVTYQAHVQDYGWMKSVKDGETAGTTEKSMRLEGLKITLNDKDGNSMIRYKAHVQDPGWQDWKKSGELAGTENMAKRLEGVKIELVGDYAKKYDIYYRAHVAMYGWLGWAKNGELAGSEYISLRMEAIQIKLVKKGESFDVGGKHEITKPSITYQAHVQGPGWKSTVKEAETAGTTGEARRLEAVKINLLNENGQSAVEYRAHVEGPGWQSWKKSGEVAGTTEQSRRLEAIEIKLTGNLANYYDIYYRMHVAEDGWLGWAKNGETAGTTGGSRRAEAIQIKLVVKGTQVDRGEQAYKKLQSVSSNINASEVFVKQASGGRCTLAANVMMLRRYAMLTGNSNWSGITESTTQSSLWSSQGMKCDYTYSGINVLCYANANGFKSMTPANKEAHIKGLLASHPEGIVLYDWDTASCYSRQHAVLVTDYTNGEFYCADPASGVAGGRIKMSSSLVKTVGQCEQYWIVAR